MTHFHTPLDAIRHFFKLQSASGILLVIAAFIALIMANSPFQSIYDHLLETHFEIRLGELQLDKPLLLWINDGLMAIFFLLVALEIKREIVDGELRTVGQIMLPGIAAAGGMLIPALIYTWLNLGNQTDLRGWAIPAATDIAFALGVLSLLGKRVPVSLKVFLTALAVMDDLGAIVIIAIFYSGDLSWSAHALAFAATIVLILMNRIRFTSIAAYCIVGLFLWVCVLKSGVHATIAGVVLGFTIPLRAKDSFGRSPLRYLEHTLHPWVAYGILPVFAFANAGVSFRGLTVDTFFSNVSLGIALGLFVGKMIGVFGFTYASIKLGLAQFPRGATWKSIFGVSILCGIGFTMSLFIGTLAFPREGADYSAAVRIGVLGGSFVSAVVGYIILHFALPHPTVEPTLARPDIPDSTGGSDPTAA